MNFNWKTPFGALGGMGAAVAMMALARSPVAANPQVMFAAAAITSQFATAFGFIGSRFDQLRKRADTEVRTDDAENESRLAERADRASPEVDTAPGSGENEPTRIPEALNKQLGEDLYKMVQAHKRGDYAEVAALAESVGQSIALNKQGEDIDRMVQAHQRGDHAEVAALADSVRQSAAELGRLEVAEPGGPSREKASRGSAGQDAPPQSERGGASDGAQRTTDDRAATTLRAGQASDADARGAAGAQTDRDEASSRSGSPDDVQQRAEANEAPDRPDGQPSARGASAGEVEGAETGGQRHDADPTGRLRTEHDVATGERVERRATGLDEGESPAASGDPSAERVSAEAGGEPEPPSPEPFSEPSREPRLPVARYPGPGVTAEQLQAMKGPAPKFAPPEAVTDVASRKQAALAAMTSERTGVAQRSESTTAEPGQSHQADPSAGADPAPPLRDREMD